MRSMKKLSFILPFLLALAPAARSQDVFDLLRKGDVTSVKGRWTPPAWASFSGPPANSAAPAGGMPLHRARRASYLLFPRQYELWASFRGADGAWSEPVNLGPGVNSPSVELCPIVTADGKYLFFLSQRDGESHAYWVRADVIEKLRPAAQKKRPVRNDGNKSDDKQVDNRFIDGH